MTPRERVLRTFRFESTDRPPHDLMEGTVWPELLEYFRAEHGLDTGDRVQEFLGTDFRWVMTRDRDEPESGRADAPQPESQTHSVAGGPLAGAARPDEVAMPEWSDPARWQPPDFQAARRRWPDHAIALLPRWRPLFWGACEAFGLEQALVNLKTRPELFEAFVEGQHRFYMDVLRRCMAAGQGLLDVCWLGDDFASQQGMMLSPEDWRRMIKPRLAEQVALAREHGMQVLYHSCGAVRPVLWDLHEIGVTGLLVFQTRVRGMEPDSIAREFGGRLVFYGGIDVQQLLSFGSPDEVEATVKGNARAFADCGGYVVANSHHSVSSIRGENVEAMCAAARALGPVWPTPHCVRTAILAYAYLESSTSAGNGLSPLDVLKVLP